MASTTNTLTKGQSTNACGIASVCIVAALLVISFAAAFNDAAARRQGPSDGQQSVEVLTRGPEHEAFAEAVTFDPQPGVGVFPKRTGAKQ